MCGKALLWILGQKFQNFNFSAEFQISKLFIQIQLTLFKCEMCGKSLLGKTKKLGKFKFELVLKALCTFWGPLERAALLGLKSNLAQALLLRSPRLRCWRSKIFLAHCATSLVPHTPILSRYLLPSTLWNFLQFCPI